MVGVVPEEALVKVVLLVYWLGLLEMTTLLLEEEVVKAAVLDLWISLCDNNVDEGMRTGSPGE